MAFFSGSSNDIERLRSLGLTDHAITVYLVAVRNGTPKEAALLALLQGRTLNVDQVELARGLLDRLYLQLGHSAGQG